MTVFRCVSSKSSTCELMPFIKRGVQDVHPLASSEQAGLIRARKTRERAHGDVDCLVAGPADGATRPVQQRAARFRADWRR